MSMNMRTASYGTGRHAKLCAELTQLRTPGYVAKRNFMARQNGLDSEHRTHGQRQFLASAYLTQGNSDVVSSVHLDPILSEDFSHHYNPVRNSDTEGMNVTASSTSKNGR